MSQRVCFVVASLAVAAASLTVARAAPSNTTISAAYQVSRCGSSTCGSGDPKLSSGAVATGAVQFDVTSHANFGLQSVQLQAIGGGEATYQCVHLWSAGGANDFAQSAMWDTATWPRPNSVTGCTEQVTHKHGEPVPNGSYTLRVIARDGSNQEQISPEFVLRLSNPAQAPLWRGAPAVSGGAVTLRWYRNAEPDVVEYRFTRTDAKGSKVIAIDAAAPTHTSGCAPEQEATFTCTDHPAAGTVRYTLRAYRPTPANEPSCKTRPSPCIGSAAAPQQTVKVSGGGPGPGPTATNHTTPPATGGSTTSPSVGSTPAPNPTSTNTGPHAPPTGGTTPIAAPPNREEGNRTAPIALASAGLAALVLAHSALRRRAPGDQTGKAAGPG
jgi:hypothetical protein